MNMLMENPDTVEQILLLLEHYAGRELRMRNLLAALLKHGTETGNARAIADLAFQAKYVSKLIDTLKRQEETSEHSAHLSKELSAGIEHFHSLITEFVSDAPMTSKLLFEQELLHVSEASLQRLVAFASDLSILKNLEMDFLQFESSKETHVADNPDR